MRFLDDFSDKVFLVAGTGKSGIAAVNLLKGKVRRIIVVDGNKELDRAQTEAKIGNGADCRLILGEPSDDELKAVDIAVLSPGVPLDSPLAVKLRKAGVSIWGEIELAYLFSRGKVFAITGTNGKTTATALTGEILKSHFKDVFVVGNIGEPYAGSAALMEDDSVTVAEVSSFQLETVCRFKPDISAILNITPDHLDRHHTMDSYIEAKARIAAKQDEGDVCVLNYEDARLREISKKIRADVFWFSSRQKLERGIWLEDGQIVYKDRERVPICHVDDMRLLGRHNYENAMAAVAIAMRAGVPVEKIRTALREFKAVEHRIEFVREADGISYYNDSKGTNPDAAIKAVEAMTAPTVLIAGGYDKNASYDEWISSFEGRVKCLVLLGETADKIALAARKAGFDSVIKTKSLKEAVEAARGQAKPGDAVLLSPACASWDMFIDYVERGNVFKELVGKI